MAREIELVITVENEQALRELRKVDDALVKQEAVAKQAGRAIEQHEGVTAKLGTTAKTTASTTDQLTQATTREVAAVKDATTAQAAHGRETLSNADRIKRLREQTAEQVRQEMALESSTTAATKAAKQFGVETRLSQGALMALAGVQAAVTLGFIALAKSSVDYYLKESGYLDRYTAEIDEVKRAWNDFRFALGERIVGGIDAQDELRAFAAGIRGIGDALLATIDALREWPRAMAVAGLAGPLGTGAGVGLAGLARGAGQVWRGAFGGGPERPGDMLLSTGASAWVPSVGITPPSDADLEKELRALWASYHQNVARAERESAKLATRTAGAAAAADVFLSSSDLALPYFGLAGLGGLSRGQFAFGGWAPQASSAIGGLDSRTGAMGWSPSVTAGGPGVGPATPGLFSGFGGFLQQNLGPTILGALQGGGNVGGSVGGLLGGGAASAIGEGLTGKLGSMLGSVLPGIGTLLGGMAGGLVDKLFGPSQESQVKRMREAFLAGVTDLAALERQAELAGFSMQRLYDAKKVKDFERAQKDLDQALKNWEAQLRTAHEAAGGLTNLVTGWAAGLTEVTAASDEAHASFDRMGGFAFTMFANLLQHTGDFAAALDAIGPALDVLIAQQDKFGFAASTAVQNLLDIRRFNQEHPEIAQRISGLTTLVTGLAKNGWLAAEMVHDFGQEAVAAFHAATAAGATQEQALLQLQPALQVIWEHQQKNNLVLDEGTQGLIDMALASGTIGPSFRSASEQMLNVLQGIERAVDRLVDSLTGLGNVRVPEVEIPMRFVPRNTPEDAAGAYAATGGLVTATGVQYLAGGGTVLPFRPRGTDTVPAMLTPGEGVINRLGMAMLGRDRLAALNRGRSLGSGIVVQVQVDARESFYDSAASRDRLADKVGETILRKLQARDRLAARSA